MLLSFPPKRVSKIYSRAKRKATYIPNRVAIFVVANLGKKETQNLLHGDMATTIKKNKNHSQQNFVYN